MDRELNSTRSVYNSYIIDDGWNVPKNVIEVIDLRIEMAWKDAYELIKKQKEMHVGKWLTTEVAYQYERKAWAYLSINGGQYTGFVRELGENLQKKYGVTELEAVNILYGRHISDYVEKYFRMKNLIPLSINQQDVCNEVLEEYGYLAKSV